MTDHTKQKKTIANPYPLNITGVKRVKDVHQDTQSVRDDSKTWIKTEGDDPSMENTNERDSSENLSPKQEVVPNVTPSGSQIRPTKPSNKCALKCLILDLYPSPTRSNHNYKHAERKPLNLSNTRNIQPLSLTPSTVGKRLDNPVMAQSTAFSISDELLNGKQYVLEGAFFLEDEGNKPQARIQMEEQGRKAQVPKANIRLNLFKKTLKPQNTTNQNSFSKSPLTPFSPSFKSSKSPRQLLPSRPQNQDLTKELRKADSNSKSLKIIDGFSLADIETEHSYDTKAHVSLPHLKPKLFSPKTTKTRKILNPSPFQTNFIDPIVTQRFTTQQQHLQINSAKNSQSPSSLCFDSKTPSKSFITDPPAFQTSPSVSKLGSPSHHKTQIPQQYYLNRKFLLPRPNLQIRENA